MVEAEEIFLEFGLERVRYPCINLSFRSINIVLRHIALIFRSMKKAGRLIHRNKQAETHFIL